MQFGSVWDGVGDDGRAVISADHPVVPVEERGGLLTYLKSAQVIMRAPMLAADVVEPTNGAVVPQFYASDGEYVWEADLVYYLEQYGLAPDADFLAHLQARRGSTAPRLSAAEQQRALALLRGD